MSESALDRVRRPDAMRVRTMGSYDVGYELAGAAPGKPDWIDFRASVGRAERRVEAGEVVSRCWSCGTELDVVVPVHSPRCRTLVRESGRAALDAMDAGVPQRELDVQQVAASRDCATPRCAREADSGSDFCRVCDEGLRLAAERVGHETAVAPSGASLVAEPKREVETVTAAKWTRETIIEAIKAFHATHGRTPVVTDWAYGSGTDAPSTTQVKRVFGKWSDAIVAAGFPRPTRGSPKGPRSSVGEPKVREASGHSSPAASSSPPLPEGDAVVPAVSPGPVPTEAEAGHHEWLLSLGLNGEMLRDEIARLDELSSLSAQRRDALQEFLDALEAT